ncbi:hypothetical protein HY633_01905 [Candidatus Uhrbacteria bacterium]|nr:hypothetical protein [Candidatus Uhrbacteria bacterium]
MKKTFGIISTALAAAMLPFAAHAGAALDQLKNAGTGAGFNTEETDLPTIIGGIISGFLGFLGTIFVVLMIYAGYLYMTAQGNEDQVEQAKSLIKNAVIGMVIVFLAFAITEFVITQVAF